MPVKASEREGKRASLSLRTTEQLRAALEREASKSGRSLAQEIETRLEDSLREDDVMRALFGDGTHTQILARVVATAVRQVEHITEQRWVDDYETLWHARAAVRDVLEDMFGSIHSDTAPVVEGRSENEQARMSRLYRHAAIFTLRNLGMRVPAPPFIAGGRGEVTTVGPVNYTAGSGETELEVKDPMFATNERKTRKITPKEN